MWPVAAGVAVGVGVVLLGIPFWASGLCFALCAFVTTTIVQEFVRGAAVRQRATGTDLFTALVGLFARSRRRYGGYIVHLGIVLMFLGFAGKRLRARRDRSLLKPGQQVERRRPTPCTYQRADGHRGRPEADGHGRPRASRGTASRSAACIRRAGSSADARTSRRPKSRCGAAFADDLYLVLAGYDVEPPDSDASGAQSIRSSTGSGSASASWSSARSSRSCRSARSRLRRAACPKARRRRRCVAAAVVRRRRGVCSAQHVEIAADGRRSCRRRRSRRELQSDIICMCGTAAGKARRVHLPAMPPRCARRLRGLVARARPRRDHPVLRRRSTAARKCWPRRSTRASIAWPGCCRTPSGVIGHRRGRRRGAALVAARTSGATARRRARRVTAPTSRSDSTMSSASSTDRRAPSRDAGFQPWHFYLLLSMAGATCGCRRVARTHIRPPCSC